MRRRKLLFRIVEPARKNARTNRNGVYSKPTVSSRTAARIRARRDTAGIDERPEFLVPLGGQVRMMRLMRHAVEAEAHEAEGSNDHAIDFI